MFYWLKLKNYQVMYITLIISVISKIINDLESYSSKCQKDKEEGFFPFGKLNDINS